MRWIHPIEGNLQRRDRTGFGRDRDPVPQAAEMTGLKCAERGGGFRPERLEQACVWASRTARATSSAGTRGVAY